MNVIVSNKQKEIIDNANIDAIKDLNGLFSVDDLVNKFKNYFFSKMILDATSVIDFATRDVLQKLVDEIGSDRLIILLPSKPEPPEEFKKLLLDLKIYNFSNKIEDVVGFIEKPNTFENVMNGVTNSHSNGNDYYVDNSIKSDDINNQPLNNEEISKSQNNQINNNVTSVNMNGYSNNNGEGISINHTSLGDIMNRFSVDNSNNNNNIYNESNVRLENMVPNGNIHVNNTVNSVSNGQNIFLKTDDYNENKSYDANSKVKKIIGFRNVTLHAGSTTLIYMLQKVAQMQNMDVLSIEINSDDFRLFRDNKMISIKENDIANIFNSIRENLVFVDLNNCMDDSFCTDLVYLVEPSTIKLNKLMMMDKNAFGKLKDKKVVLNKSMLSNNDISILEREAGIRFFDNITFLNDRINNFVIEDLLKRLIG